MFEVFNPFTGKTMHIVDSLEKALWFCDTLPQADYDFIRSGYWGLSNGRFNLRYYKTKAQAEADVSIANLGSDAVTYSYVYIDGGK